MKITITDIARDTGLAVSTISKYLNHKNILPENEALIEASIKKLGYTPNRIAQGLRAKSSHTVALLIPSKNNYFWGNSVSYITSFLWEQGYVCTIHTYPPEKEKQLQLGQLLINNNIRGLIAVTGTLEPRSLKPNERKSYPHGSSRSGQCFVCFRLCNFRKLSGRLSGRLLSGPQKSSADWLCCRPQGCLYDCPENFRFSERTKGCKTSCLSGALLL